MQPSLWVSSAIHVVALIGGIHFLRRAQDWRWTYCIVVLAFATLRILIRLAFTEGWVSQAVNQAANGAAAQVLFSCLILVGMGLAAQAFLENRQRALDISHSQRRWQAMLENFCEGFLLTDANGDVQYASPYSGRLLGIEPGPGAPRPMDLVHPDDRALAAAQFRWALANPGREPRRVTVRLRHADGSYRWVEGTAVSMLTDPAVRAVVTNWRDVSPQKRMEQDLERNLALLQTVIDGVAEGIFVKDVAGRYILVNQSAARLSQRSVQELLQLDDLQLFGKEIGSRIREIDRQVREEGRVFDQQETVTFGSRQYVFSIVKTPYRAPNGEVMGVIGVARDITERIEREAAIQDRARQTRSFIECSPMAMAMLDQDLKYLAYSKRWISDLQLPDSNLIGRSHYEVFPDVPQRWRDVNDRCLQGEVASCDDDSFTRSNGEVVYLRWQAGPWRNGNNQIAGIILVTEIVTEEKRVQEELRKTQSQLAHVGRLLTMGEMTAAIAHEVNQPLYAIQNFATACSAELRAAQPNIQKVERWTSQIAQQAQRVGEIIHRLRSFAAKRPPHRDPLDINLVVRDAVALMAAEARSRSISVETDLQSLSTVEGDRIGLTQVLVNLIRNAFEAVEQSNRKKKVLIRTAPAQGRTQVSVIDSGPGFDLPEPSQVFDAFYTTKPEGLGLGLAISRSIIGASGGRLWAEADPAGGAAFHFLI
jgi:PAS domain S-box-containing protein